MISSLSSIGLSPYTYVPTSNATQQTIVRARIEALQAQLTRSSGDSAKVLQQQVDTLNVQLQSLQGVSASSNVASS